MSSLPGPSPTILSYPRQSDAPMTPSRPGQEKNYQFALRELERVQQERLETELRQERER